MKNPAGILVVASLAMLLAFYAIFTRQAAVEVENGEAFAESIIESKERMKRDFADGIEDGQKAEEVRERYFSDIQKSLGQLADTRAEDQRRFAELTQAYIADVADRARVWNTAFLAVNNESTLDFADLRTEGAFAKRKAAIDDYVAATEHYTRFYDGMLDELAERLSPLGSDNEFVIGALKGAREQRSKQDAIMATVMKAHVQYAADLRVVLDLLESRFDAWETQDGQILFVKETDLADFQDAIGRLVQTETLLNESTARLIQGI